MTLTLVFALFPGTFGGAPAAASKYTLCGTLPKAKVTVPPGAIVVVAGEKAMLGVALTVAWVGDGDGGVVPGGAVLLLPLHALAARRISDSPMNRMDDIL
ncbi:MAG: hypothetical protein ABI194_03290 [Gemmatimonadaceae bacterium]